MKKIFIVATALLFALQFNLTAQTSDVQTATAQTSPRGEVAKVERERKVLTPEEREAKMTERMVQQLLLSDAEAAKFAPLYKKYMAEKRALRPERAEKRERGGKRGESTTKVTSIKVTPTDAEIKKAAKERFVQQRKMVDLQENYYNQFSKFLTAQQVEKVMRPNQERGARAGEMRRKEARGMQPKGAEMRKGKAMGRRTAGSSQVDPVSVKKGSSVEV
ncbi:MAG: DUF4890 domain-containing protein [Phocaeicola sp.]